LNVRLWEKAMREEQEESRSQLPTSIFGLLCIGAGIVGACIALAIGFVILGIVAFAIYGSNEPREPAKFAMFALWLLVGVIGFIRPIIILRRRRRNRSKPTPVKIDQPRNQLPTPIFILLCMVVGTAGALIVLAVSSVLIGVTLVHVYDLNQLGEAANGVILVLLMFFVVLGFIFPIVILRRRRRGAFRPAHVEIGQASPPEMLAKPAQSTIAAANS
jgi:uncharacterized BrkB/YihY/UPF0761 family membrane protein